MSERGKGGEPAAHTDHCSFMGEIKAVQYYPNLPKCCLTPSPPATTGVWSQEQGDLEQQVWVLI